MALQLLVSAVGQDVQELVKKMNIQSDAIVVNQKMPYAFTSWEEEKNGRKFQIKSFSMQEKGVGLSRTTALQRADQELVLFSDDDIVYEDDYAKKVEDAFREHPEADVLLFNVKVQEERRTYWTDAWHPVRWYNCGRYPAYSIAMRTEKMHGAGLTYHLWFGGGARYSCGEDSLFLRDAIHAGLKAYAIPVCIGEEKPRDVENGQEASTWFQGYNEKFFYDRGVLYHHLYGKLAPIMAFRFLFLKRKWMCREIPYAQAKKLMRDGYSRK